MVLCKKIAVKAFFRAKYQGSFSSDGGSDMTRTITVVITFGILM